MKFNKLLRIESLGYKSLYEKRRVFKSRRSNKQRNLCFRFNISLKYGVAGLTWEDVS